MTMRKWLFLIVGLVLGLSSTVRAADTRDADARQQEPFLGHTLFSGLLHLGEVSAADVQADDCAGRIVREDAGVMGLTGGIKVSPFHCFETGYSIVRAEFAPC
jgi:hypothetical protein